MSPSRPKNTVRSVIRSMPVIRRRPPSSGSAPRPSARIPNPVGRRNALSALPSRNELSRPGASRKSSALRDGGVSSTSRSNSLSSVELVQLGDRGQLLRSRDRGRQLAIDAVGLDLLGALGIGRDPLDQLVERPLGVEHHRPQLALDLEPRSRPAARARRGGARSRAARARARWRAGWPGRSSRPRPWRRAPPSRARPPPTSSSCRRRPTPAHTHTRLPLEHLGDVHSAASSARRVARARQAEVLGEHVGQLGQPAVRLRRAGGPAARAGWWLARARTARL